MSRFPQNVLDPAGPQAASVASLWTFMLVVSAGVLLAVVAAMLYALFHRKRRADVDHAEEEPPGAERRTVVSVAAAAAISAVILLVFLVLDFGTQRALASLREPSPLTIELTGHQWWWQVEYVDSVPERRITTANEIHIPVGRPVFIKTASRDVIHSFWAPNLHGKRDLVPGHQGALVLQADAPGRYRAQCAEFCGRQHAKMALWVVAHPEAEFQAWAARERLSARTPTDSLAARGREVFLQRSCVMCHSIRGTSAASNAGPDLTHLASRLTIAAGTLPNTTGHLAGWIVNPQRIKPGALMPPNPLAPAELDALLAYLSTLR